MKCPECDRGWIDVFKDDTKTAILMKRRCPNCEGKGEVPDQPKCPNPHCKKWEVGDVICPDTEDGYCVKVPRSEIERVRGKMMVEPCPRCGGTKRCICFQGRPGGVMEQNPEPRKYIEELIVRLKEMELKHLPALDHKDCGEIAEILKEQMDEIAQLRAKIEDIESLPRIPKGAYIAWPKDPSLVHGKYEVNKYD
jgi:hypothetical protein